MKFQKLLLNNRLSNRQSLVELEVFWSLQFFYSFLVTFIQRLASFFRGGGEWIVGNLYNNWLNDKSVSVLYYQPYPLICSRLS
jgi:hypothetical protein